MPIVGPAGWMKTSRAPQSRHIQARQTEGIEKPRGSFRAAALVAADAIALRHASFSGAAPFTGQVHRMSQRIVDLSVAIEDNMPAHKLFQRPVITTHLSHEKSKAFDLGVPGDAMTFQTNFIAMLDHVGTHVDAFRHVKPDGAPIDEMPLDLFMGKAVCFDLRHIPDLGDIEVADMEAAEAKSGVKIDGHIVLLCTGFHARNYPSLDSVWKNPLLTVEATKWLHARGSRMHGVEGPSTDKPTDNIFAQHRLCRDLGISHWEWLVNLEELIGKGEFQFFGVPLKFKGGSGSPVRAFALLPN
jgi:kynurenine formamidase